MKNKMKKELLLSCFFALILTVNAQSPLSIEEAMALVKANNHALKQTDLLDKEKEMQMKAARGLYFPIVSVSANYARMSENIELDLTPVKDAITPLYSALSKYGNFSGVPNPDPATSTVMPKLPDNVSTSAVRGQLADGLEKIEAGEWVRTIQNKSFATLSAEMAWPIFTGGKISAVNKAAQIHYAETENVRQQKTGELISELVERYYGLCLAQQVVTVRREVEVGMKKHLTDATKLQEQGMIANAEKLHAQVYYSTADRELKKSLRDVEIVNQAVLNTLASKGNDSILPTSMLFITHEIESIEYFKAQANSNNPLLKQVDSKKELAHQGVRLASSDYLPSIAAMGTYDIANKDLSPYIPKWMVGVGLRWTVFDGAARTKKVMASKMVEAQVDEFRANAGDDIATAIEKYYQELMKNLEQYDQLEHDMNFALEYLRIREKSFAEGMSTSTEVTDAQMNLAKIKTERLNTIYQFDVALAKLLEFSGESDRFIAYEKSNKAIKVSYSIK